MLLVQLDEAYGRLSQRLEGLSDEEYLWQPVPGGWSIRCCVDGRWAADYAEPDPVPAPFTTVAWRLLHIADCKVMYHEHAYGPGVLTFPDLEAPRTAAAAIARLVDGQRSLRDDLTRMPDDASLDAQVATNWGELWPAWRIFWTMIEHDAWHGGEIGALRDLYASRSTILPNGEPPAGMRADVPITAD